MPPYNLRAWCLIDPPKVSKETEGAIDGLAAGEGMLKVAKTLSVCPETLGVFSITCGYHHGSAIEIAWLYSLRTKNNGRLPRCNSLKYHQMLPGGLSALGVSTVQRVKAEISAAPMG